ncbi:MAG: alpha/beta fold hydrolase [Pseudoclavibacter sp.]
MNTPVGTSAEHGSQHEYTTPPERVTEHLVDVAKMWASLPETLPRMLETPEQFFEEQAPLGEIAKRLARIPQAPVGPSATDGQIEDIASARFTHRFIHAPGDGEPMRWHVVESGPETGEVVVFLHGVPDSWFQWHLAMAALSDTYRCIAIDLKGYGQSPKHTGDYRHEGVADQLISLLDVMGIDRFSLVTHDRGTPPADHMVAKLGDRVIRYGRGQQHLWHLHPSLHPQEKMFTSVNAPFVLGNARATVIVAYTALTSRPVADDLLVRTITEFSYPGIDQAVPRYFHSSSMRQEWIERRDRLIEAWQCPVLFLQGRDDPGQPHEFYTDPDVLSLLPTGSGLHLFDAGHFWPFEVPDAAADVLRRFLNDEFADD